MKGPPLPDQQIDDFLGFLEDDRLPLPHVPSPKFPRETGGKTYYVEQPNAKVGAQLAALGELMVKQARGIELNGRDIARLQFSDDEEVEFGNRVLGDAYDEMAADGVRYGHIKASINYAFIAFAFNEDAAREMAAAGQLSGKPVPPENRAARRANEAKTRKAKTKAPTAPSK